jgi:hypothetical protein
MHKEELVKLTVSEDMVSRNLDFLPVISQRARLGTNLYVPVMRLCLIQLEVAKAAFIQNFVIDLQVGHM